VRLEVLKVMSENNSERESNDESDNLETDGNTAGNTTITKFHDGSNDESDDLIRGKSNDDKKHKNDGDTRDVKSELLLNRVTRGGVDVYGSGGIVHLETGNYLDIIDGVKRNNSNVFGISGQKINVGSARQNHGNSDYIGGREKLIESDELGKGIIIGGSRIGTGVRIHTDINAITHLGNSTSKSIHRSHKKIFFKRGIEKAVRKFQAAVKVFRKNLCSPKRKKSSKPGSMNILIDMPCYEQIEE
jgi:hypothetical protein